MFRRYVLPCALIMAVSYGTAGVAYIGAGSDRFKASCGFEVVLGLTQQPLQTKEAIAAHNSIAQKEVLVAAAGGVFADVAKAQNMKTNDLKSETLFSSIPGLGTFNVIVYQRDPKRAGTLVNAVCDEFVATVKKQRTTEIDTNKKAIEKRISTAEAEVRRLAAIPKNKRTSADVAVLISQQAILRANVQRLASLLSLPPDNIAVLTRAGGGQKIDDRSLGKNVLIALIAGLLACFLLVLVGEMVAESRRRTARASGEP